MKASKVSEQPPMCVAADEDLRDRGRPDALSQRNPDAAAPIVLPVIGGIEGDRAVGYARRLEKAAHGPAELAPFHPEHDHRLVAVGDRLRDEGLGFRRQEPNGLAVCSRRRRLHIEAVARRGLGDADFLFRHLGRDVGEERRAEIALAGVGQHAEHLRPRRRLRADRERAGERRAAGDAGEDAFLARQLARQAERVGAGDGHDLVDQPGVDRIFRELGDEVRRPALHRMRPKQGVALGRLAVGDWALANAAGEDLRVIGLADDDLRVRPVLLQDTRDALQRSARAHAGDPVVEPGIGEIVQDLDRRRLRMEIGIGLVLELAAEEPAVLLRELHRLAEHAGAPLRSRGQHDLGAEETHQLAALDAETLRHRHDERIALLRAHHGEPDAGIAAGRFDHRLAGLQRTAPLRRLDDAERQPVLDRAERVEGLDFHEQLHAGRRELFDLHDGRAPDRLQDVGEPSAHVSRSQSVAPGAGDAVDRTRRA